jgi:sulfur carrier protein
MTDIQVNGETLQVDDGVTVSDLLVVQKVKMPEMVSVELNGTILERDAFGATVLKEGDKIEFLYFMGGGSRLRSEATA